MQLAKIGVLQIACLLINNKTTFVVLGALPPTPYQETVAHCVAPAPRPLDTLPPTFAMWQGLKGFKPL